MRNKIKTFYIDLVNVSKLTRTKNKKIIIFLLSLILNLQILFDILIILYFSRFFSQEIGINNQFLNSVLNKNYLLPFFITFRYLFTYLDVYITSKLRFTIEKNLKEHLMKEVFDKGNYLISDAYFYVHTISEQVGGFYSTLATFIGSLVQIVFFSMYLLLTNFTIFLTFVVGFIIVSIPGYFLTKFGRKHAHIAYIKADELSSNLEKVLDNSYLIKILQLVKKEVNHYSKNLNKYYKSRLNEINSGTLNHIMPVTLTLLVLSIFLVFFQGIKLITFDFIGVLIRLFQALGLLNKNVHVLSAYHVYLEKLYQIEQNRGNKYVNNFIISEDENDQIIKFQNVSFKYFDSDKYIFEDLNLNFDKNKHTVITGPNGSGKSTLIGLLSGILYPEKGTVKISQCKFGYVGAKPMILNSTLRENLLYGNNEDINDENLIKTIKKFNLFDEEEKYNLDEVVSNKNLSSGQMQKIAFSRVLLNDVNVLILDESTANLDQETKNQIYEIISQLDITIINSTHSIDELLDFDIQIQIQFDKDEKKIINKTNNI
jgi:ABC-type multidrug transport system fused ATPase/permease subunit